MRFSLKLTHLMVLSTLTVLQSKQLWKAILIQETCVLKLVSGTASAYQIGVQCSVHPALNSNYMFTERAAFAALSFFNLYVIVFLSLTAA